MANLIGTVSFKSASAEYAAIQSVATGNDDLNDTFTKSLFRIANGEIPVISY